MTWSCCIVRLGWDRRVIEGERRRGWRLEVEMFKEEEGS